MQGSQSCLRRDALRGGGGRKKRGRVGTRHLVLRAMTREGGKGGGGGGGGGRFFRRIRRVKNAREKKRGKKKKKVKEKGRIARLHALGQRATRMREEKGGRGGGGKKKKKSARHCAHLQCQIESRVGGGKWGKAIEGEKKGGKKEGGLIISKTLLSGEKGREK